MKTKIPEGYLLLILILALISPLGCSSDEPKDFRTLPAQFYMRLEGNIDDKLHITMNITRQDTNIIGTYYYNSKKIPIEFGYNSKVDSSGNVYLEEGYYDTKTFDWVLTGIFKGKFISDREIRGKWINPNTKAQYDFVLTENYPRGTAQFKLQYKEKSYGQCEMGPCVYISFSYPVLKNFPDKSIEDDLNPMFKNNVFDNLKNMPAIDTNRKYESMEEIMDSFINSYKEEVEGHPDLNVEWKQMWSYNKTIRIDQNFDDIVSVTNGVDQYLGGAHGSAFFEIFSIDMKTGKIIKAEDILKPGYKTQLTKIAEKLFRKQWKLGPNDDLNEAGFFFENNVFFLNDNFYILPSGLKFQYNQYEIAAYALGAPELVIPFSEIRDLIRSDGLLYNLAKEK